MKNGQERKVIQGPLFDKKAKVRPRMRWKNSAEQDIGSADIGEDKWALTLVCSARTSYMYTHIHTREYMCGRCLAFAISLNKVIIPFYRN